VVLVAVAGLPGQEHKFFLVRSSFFDEAGVALTSVVLDALNSATTPGVDRPEVLQVSSSTLADASLEIEGWQDAGPEAV
jgi:hypothetical protein